MKELLALLPTEESILDLKELELIKSHTKQFNEFIENVVTQSNGRLALIDINKHLCKAADGKGVETDGITLKSDFLSGGIFSLDGLHATPRGNAYIANILIETVNKHFNQRIERLNVASYPDIRPAQN